MSCDLCGGVRFDAISQLDRLGQPLETVICQRCALVSHRPIPSEKEIARYYTERYRQEYHGEQDPSARRVMRAWKNAERIFNQLEPNLRPGMDVFEVGAGIGCTVRLFELNGFDASGIEPGQSFNHFSREKIRAKVKNMNLFDLEPEAGHDIVLLIHVIEHFTSPSNALAHVHALLKPEGRLYIECPNLAAPFSTFPRMFHFAHIYNFTPQSLIAMAEKCGFGVEKVFSDENDPNIQILFASQKPGKPSIEQGVADKTRVAMQRYNILSYHLRWNYLQARFCKLYSYFSEAIFSQSYMKRLLQRCGE